MEFKNKTSVLINTAQSQPDVFVIIPMLYCVHKKTTGDKKRKEIMKMKKLNDRAMEKVNGGSDTDEEKVNGRVIRITPEDLMWIERLRRNGRLPRLDSRTANTPLHNSNYRTN